MIIHSPIISGSLTFADGSTFTLPDGGNYSGSFSGSIQIAEVQSHLIPDTTEVYDLGSATHRFRDIYLSDATIKLGSGKFGITGGIFQMTTNDDVPMTLGVGSMQLKPVGFPPISLTSTSTGFNLTDEDDEPAPMQVKSLSIKSASNSVSDFSIGTNNGKISFTTYGSGTCATYSLTNNDVQENLFFSYTDCNGDPVNSSLNTTQTTTLQALEGSFQRTSGTDDYRIKLISYDTIESAPVEVGRLELPIPNGPTFVIDPLPIDPENPAGGGSISFNISGSDTPAEVKTGNIVVSGSNGTSTITNDLPGEGLAVTDSTGSVQPIKVKTVSIVDSETGDVVELSVSSGSLNTTATNSSGSAIADPKSNLSGSFTGSIGLTGDITSEADCVKIGTELNPICDIYATRITGSLSGTVNGINIVDVKSDVDAILSGSQADKDSFAEIVTLINSVDTTNDEAFAGFVTSSNAAQDVQDGRLTALESGSASITSNLSAHEDRTDNPHSVTKTQVGLGNVDNTSDSNKPVSTAQQTALDGKLNINGDGVVSGSSQITITESQISDLTHFTISDLPTGTVSGSVQVDVLQTTNFTEFSSSVADTFGGLSTDYNDLQNIPSGIISSSEQLAADFLDTLGDNVVSSSAQIDLTQTTNYASGIKLKLDAENVFSSSEQVTLGDVTGFNTFSSSVSDTFDGLSSNYEDLVGIPSGIVSGSSQIDVTQTTNYSTVSSHISSTSNPHSVTKSQVGLGNVDNTSDANKPISTATQNALDLKATTADLTVQTDRIDDLELFSSSLDGGFVTEAELAAATGALEITISNHTTRTDNPHSVTATQVGLENVTNESKATMFTSPTFTGTVSGVTATHVGLGSVTNESKSTMFTSPTFTGTVSGVTASHVGLGNVDNTSDADKPVSTATQTALNGKLDTTHDFSITLTGDVTGTGTVTNMGNVSFATVVGDDSHNHTIANVDGLQDALDGKQSAGSFVTTDSAQSLSSAANALTLSGNTLTLARGDSSTDTIDLSAYLDEDSRSISSGTLNSVSGIVTFTRDDASTFTLDLSDLLDDTNLVTSVAGRNGVVTLDTDDVVEAGNKYYTDARVKTKLNVEGVISGSEQVTITQSQVSDVTATAAELNILDGVTATTAELNFVDGVTSKIQTQLNGKQASLGFTPYDATNPVGYTTYTSNQATNTTSNVTFASVSATGDVVAYASSDRRLKDNIVNIENPIEKVQKLNGVTWDWNGNADELQQSLPNVGVIAQEVEEVFPQLVHDRENGYKGVDYAKLTGLLIEAVKEQQKQIDELKSRLG